MNINWEIMPCYDVAKQFLDKQSDFGLIEKRVVVLGVTDCNVLILYKMNLSYHTQHVLELLAQ